MKDVCDDCPYDHCDQGNCIDRLFAVVTKLADRIEQLEGRTDQK